MSNVGLNNQTPDAPIPSSKMYYSISDEQTLSLGYQIGRQLPVNSILCFFGDLGAGKTTFIKGLASGATGCSCDEVGSPTFVYLNIYPGTSVKHPTVYHFDLYRLKDTDEFLSMGFDEYFFAGGICCVEWSEKIADILPQNCIKVVMAHQGGNARTILITSSISL
jgi:tRNA threonylcarbamoyladenosine biosynthesis protein TsaE